MMVNDMAPRGLRNNNPGNLRVSRHAWRGKVKGALKRDRVFEEFVDMPHGYRALIKCLQSYSSRGIDTLRAMITRWAPASENNTEAYIRRVSELTGIHPGRRVDVRDKATMVALASAISEVENGVPAVLRDVEEGWALL